MQYSLIAILSLLMLFANSEILRMYQLNGYTFLLNKKTKKLLLINLFIAAFLMLITYFLMLHDCIYLSWCLIYSVLILEHLILKIYRRQQLSITKRFIRLTIAVFILNYLNIFLLYKVSLYLTPLVLIIEVIIIIFSKYITLPLEKIIKNSYMKKAKAKLKNKDLIVIGITGSFGKTTVKNILKQMLEVKYKVFMTEKNYNTTWGVIKSINKLKDEEVFIVEMGARNIGDIKEICNLVNPNIGILTGVENQHLSTFKNIENIKKAKQELQESVKDFMVFNDLNKHVVDLKKIYINKKEGILENNINIINEDVDKTEFSFLLNSVEYKVCTNMILQHNVTNIMLAVKCALYLGIDIKSLLKTIENLKNVENRFKLTKENEITIIDDSYNANIVGCMNALNFLKKFNGRKIIFTQGIVELGKKQAEENFNLGKEISKVADIVILLGVNKNYIKNGLKENNFNIQNVIEITSFNEINIIFSKILKKGDIVLIQNDLTDNY